MLAPKFEEYDQTQGAPGAGAAPGAAPSQGNSIVVYGADWCPWTRRQKTELAEAGIEYQFKDCQAEECPGITGFPTIEVAGQQLPGFKDADSVKALLSGN